MPPGALLCGRSARSLRGAGRGADRLRASWAAAVRSEVGGDPSELWATNLRLGGFGQRLKQVATVRSLALALVYTTQC